MLRMTILALMLSLSTGCVYTSIQVPMDKNFEETDISTKEGTASTRTVLYLVSWGDSGAKAAALEGDIQKINYADRQIFSVLFGLYTRITTVVYGD